MLKIPFEAFPTEILPYNVIINCFYQLLGILIGFVVYNHVMNTFFLNRTASAIFILYICIEQLDSFFLGSVGHLS